MSASETDPDLEHDLALLREIAEIGTDVARILHQHLKADPARDPQTVAPAVAEAIERIARAVRRTIHLRQHLRTNALAKTTQRTAIRADIIRRVENTIDTAVRDPARADTLRAELVDRLELPEFEHDVQTRPAADIAQDILRDLGLGPHSGFPPTRRRTPADLRALYDRAKKPPTPAPSLLDHLLRKR